MENRDQGQLVDTRDSIFWWDQGPENLLRRKGTWTQIKKDQMFYIRTIR